MIVFSCGCGTTNVDVIFPISPKLNSNSGSPKLNVDAMLVGLKELIKVIGPNLS